MASHTVYIPNEAELQIINLQNYHQNLSTLSSQVNAAGNAIITGRKDRDNILYFADDNIIDLIKDIKSYLKSLGEAGLPYYKAMVKLKFKLVK